MIAKDCMTKEVEIGNPEWTLKEAASKMKQGDFGMLPIGENDRLVGAITDRDIAIRAVAEGKDPNTVKVREVMSKGIHYCFEDQSLDEITKNFGNHQLRRLPVLNRQKRLVGILSLGNVAQADIEPDKIEDALYQISQPTGGTEARAS